MALRSSSRTIATLLVVGAMLAAPSAARAAPAPLWESRYDAASGDGVLTAWRAAQKPSLGASGPVQEDRIRTVDPAAVPGTGRYRPTGRALRVELRPYETSPGARNGDVYNSSGQLANRAEVYARNPVGTWGGTAPVNWPDPVGSERWYTFDVYVPTDFATATDTRWLTFAQWKGLYGGSPPIALEIKRDGFRLGGARTNTGFIPADGNLGKMTKGAWTRIVVGMKHSPDPATGWVEVWRDGALALPRTKVATMDRANGGADPTYLKQGIYRDSRWTTTHVLHFGPTTISAERPATS